MTLTETQPLLKSTEESSAHMAKPGAHSTPAASHAAQGLPRQLRASEALLHPSSLFLLAEWVCGAGRWGVRGTQTVLTLEPSAEAPWEDVGFLLPLSLGEVFLK